MSIFKKVKEAVSAREAAVAYGLKVKPNGMSLCPFHNDHNPSMKVDSRFYCFGCQATGDVIDLTAMLFRLNSYDAAVKLAKDFHIPGTEKYMNRR